MLSSTASNRHLYLVLDDWENGYTVHKIDVNSFTADEVEASDYSPQPLPEPPVFRVEAERAEERFFTALGTRILATSRSVGAGIPVFDTATLGVAVAPRPRGNKLRYSPAFVAVGDDRLYALDNCNNQPGCSHRFELLRPPVTSRRKKRWEWSTVSAPSPFDPNYIDSVAVHPDGRTVFFSVESNHYEKYEENSGGGGTFSFDTKLAEWSRHGSWLLPFRGRGHFDAELGAWVRLCSQADSPGHLCSCDFISPETHAGEPPQWKLGDERMFCDDKYHVGAELVYMGDSQFCVLEFLKGMSVKRKRSQEHRQPRRLLHVTVFCLKYGKQGELTTAIRRRSRAYVIPDAVAKFLAKPVAFWL